MKFLFCCLISLALLGCMPASCQNQIQRKGKLFIIGGGDRSLLMRSLVATAAFAAKDYAVVLPMSSASPDTAFYYFKADLETICTNPVVNFNFTADKVNNKNWLDSLEHARLIFITGGDQDRFMKVVLNSPVVAAIHKAYRDGATIGGTSAGAAVMSKYMITGNQLTDSTYYPTFRKIVDNNIEFKEGLGLLVPAIIDQHFVVRSRYNRLLSALAKYPSYLCIGIDEATAIIVQGNKIRVTGESQVIVMRNPKQLKITSNGLIKVEDIQFRIYTSGDEFLINQPN